MEQYFLDYGRLDQQRWMVSDEPRTSAFAHAIAEVVKPGDVVIDVGAGTGVLSILAARAGARRVIAVERSGMAPLARELIEHNGAQDRVEVFEGDAHDLVLDEKADVIVSEWLGHMAYVENMFDAVRSVRDAWLRPGGTMIPSSVQLMLAPIDAGDIFYDYGAGFWQSRVIHGIDFSCFARREVEMGLTRRMEIPHERLLGPGRRFHHLQTISAIAQEEWRAGTVVLRIERDGVLNGFVGWFSARLSPRVVLNTAPTCATTHWEHTLFPFHPTPVSAGESVSVDFRVDDVYAGSRMMEITLDVLGHSIRYLVE